MSQHLQIPGLGLLHKDCQLDWYRSNPIPLPLLKGRDCTVLMSGYEEDPKPEDFHAAIANLLACSFDVFRQAEPYIFKYYQDMNSIWWTLDDPEYLEIASEDKI